MLGVLVVIRPDEIQGRRCNKQLSFRPERFGCLLDDLPVIGAMLYDIKQEGDVPALLPIKDINST